MTDILLAYAYSLNLTCYNFRTIERNANVLLNACEDTGLIVNTRKAKYNEVGRHRGMMTNELPTIGSNSYEKSENL